MKQNLWLSAILAALLGITWLVTEKQVLEEIPPAQTALRNALVNAKRISLPEAKLLQDASRVWRTSDGEVVRAEYLQELSKMIEQIKVAKALSPRELGSGKDAFFTNSHRIGLDDFELVLGDLTPTGESFYFTVTGAEEVYLADLQEMASAAVADTDNLLQREKYHRFIDLVTLPEARWKENRLGALTQFGSFKAWKSGELSLVISELKGRPWAELILSSFQRGIASLTVQGPILKSRPAKHARIEDWVFTLEDGTQASWEFYDHPSLELIYVWIPRLGKAYPLSQESSDFLKSFLPRLMPQSFPLVLSSAPATSLRLQEEGQVWTVLEGPDRKLQFSPSTINAADAELVLDFFTTKQTFDHLTLLSPRDCQKLTAGARLKVITPEATWALLPVKGGSVFLECQAGIAIGWGKPENSALNFNSLRMKP